jgi:hypothetical protein
MINFICLTALLIVCIIQKKEGIKFYISTHSLFLYGLLLISVIDFGICKYQSRPYKQKTQQEIYIFKENEMNKFKGRYNKLLKKSTLFYPTEEQFIMDKNKIQICINNFLEQPVEKMSKSQDSIYRLEFGNMFNLNPYYVKETPSFQHEIQQPIINSITLDFISYSADFLFFIAIFTFDSSVKEGMFDTVSRSLCLIGEKASDTVYMYPQRFLVDHYGNINKEAAFYNTMEQLVRYSFYNKDKFWKNSTFFEIVTSTKTGKKDYKFKYDKYDKLDFLPAFFHIFCYGVVKQLHDLFFII